LGGGRSGEAKPRRSAMRHSRPGNGPREESLAAVRYGIPANAEVRFGKAAEAGVRFGKAASTVTQPQKARVIREG
jgi:hypothetical protein